MRFLLYILSFFIVILGSYGQDINWNYDTTSDKHTLLIPAQAIQVNKGSIEQNDELGVFYFDFNSFQLQCAGKVVFHGQDTLRLDAYGAIGLNNGFRKQDSVIFLLKDHSAGCVMTDFDLSTDDSMEGNVFFTPDYKSHIHELVARPVEFHYPPVFCENDGRFALANFEESYKGTFEFGAESELKIDSLTGTVNLHGSEPGNYTIFINNNHFCLSQDSFDVKVQKTHDVFHLDGEVLCPSDTLTVNAGQSFIDSCRWWNGAAGQAQTLTKEGMYWVEIWDTAGCHYFDTLHLSFPDIDSLIYNKDYTCNSVIIHGEGPYEYHFYNDSITSDHSIEIFQKEEIFVNVIDGYGCRFFDTIMAEPRIMDVSGMELTVHDVTCNEQGQIIPDTSAIRGGVPPFSVEMNQARTDRLFTMHDDGLPPGEYSISVYDKLGCEHTLDTIIQLTAPDHGCQNPVITPDSDGDADQYFFKKKGTLRIYNRYGQQVAGPFEAPLYWNGSGTGGQKLPTGSYMAIFDDGNHINITILR